MAYPSSTPPRRRTAPHTDRARTRRGAAAFEHAALLGALGLAASLGFVTLGRGMQRAIAPGADADAPTTLSAAPAAPAGPAAQAGLGALSRVTDTLGALARPLEAFDERTVHALEPEMRRYAVRSAATGSAALPAHWHSARTAFGAPVQFGFELEGVRVGALLDWYTPKGAADRVGLRLRPGDALARMQTERFKGLVRRSDAPPALADDVLGEIEHGVFEMRTTQPIDTQAELVDLVSRVHSRVGGSLQWHMSFVPDRKEARRVAALLGHLDEYETLRQYATDRRLIENEYRGPFNLETLRSVEKSLTRGGDFYASDAKKRRSVGFRTEIYGDRQRVGFEFRGANHDVGDASRIIDEAARALADPAHARVSLAGGAPRTLDDLAQGYDRLSVYTLDRLSPTQRATFESARPLEATGQRAVPMQEKWALPLVRWEERPWLAHRKADIEAARATFLARVDSIEKEPYAYQYKRLNEALSEWSHALQLHRDY